MPSRRWKRPIDESSPSVSHAKTNLHFSLWPILGPASHRKLRSSCFDLLSPARQAEWEWGCQSVAPLLRRMAAVSRRASTTVAARCLSSRCLSPNPRWIMNDRIVIHVIDDDAAMRDSLAFLLDVNGFKSQVYESADAFLKETSVDVARCIVSDIRIDRK